MKALSWGGIARLGLVQMALGSVVVLVTSTLNRVMVVEFSLPAILPGALVALHYGVQVLRPRMGWGSDMGGRRTPWIVGGIAAMAAGAVLAALGACLMPASLAAGVALATLGFVALGLGVGAAGTSLLTLVAHRADPADRARCAGRRGRPQYRSGPHHRYHAARPTGTAWRLVRGAAQSALWPPTWG